MKENKNDSTTRQLASILERLINTLQRNLSITAAGAGIAIPALTAGVSPLLISFFGLIVLLLNAEFR